MLLLLAHALQLLVDLLRGFDAVGIVGLGRTGGSGSLGRGCIGRDGPGLWVRLRLYDLDGSLVRLRSIVEGGCVRVGRGWAALAGSEDELRGRGSVVVDENHVTAGAVQERGENLIGISRPVLSEDALVGDAAGDLHPGIGGDLAKNLVEAGVVG